MLYLIEGLDCSGKKTIVARIKKILEDKKYAVRVIEGSSGSVAFGKLEKKLVNMYNIRKGSLLDKIRKSVYTLEPRMDYKCYKDDPDIISIRISSHYRTLARALIENDNRMISTFTKNNKKHIKYDGATILTADFDTRVKRHRYDFYQGKTNKIEKKRFFNNNKVFFEEWDRELEKIVNEEVHNCILIDTTFERIDDVANQVAFHIIELFNNKKNKNIIMIKPDALSSLINGEVASQLCRAFANHIIHKNKYKLSIKGKKVFHRAHRHAMERAISENSFNFNYRYNNISIARQFFILSNKYNRINEIPIKSIIIDGIIAMNYTIRKSVNITLSPADIDKIYPESKTKSLINMKLHKYLDNQNVLIAGISGMRNISIIQHWKTFVRHFLINNKEEKYPLQNLFHVCDGDDYNYLSAILNKTNK